MEAHAKDEWPLGKIRSPIRQHQSIEERRDAWKHFCNRRLNNVEDPRVAAVRSIPFALDSMDNLFYSTFGGWPEVHLVIQGNGNLGIRLETELGEGSIKGGTWDQLVRDEMNAQLGEKERKNTDGV
jgi:hypothetical protein